MVSLCLQEGKKVACYSVSEEPLSCRIGNTWLLAGVISWRDSYNWSSIYILDLSCADWIKTIVQDVTNINVIVEEEPVSEEGVCSIHPSLSFLLGSQ